MENTACSLSWALWSRNWRVSRAETPRLISERLTRCPTSAEALTRPSRMRSLSCSVWSLPTNQVPALVIAL
ncbi:MAG: hypothetical protein CVU56_22065 [Deltaproteobacteria bacterium HGW-Deltaproteobacteria-14]|nr:MAG: hypothetical protein CVU56_22065 [Deltaproteobacteria bacterium HGW-Deltaproteobacteria-14]